MKLSKLFGGPLTIAAVGGFIFSLTGLWAIWRYRPVVINAVSDTLTLFDSTIKTTQDGLAILGQLVQTTSIDVNSLESTTHVTAQTIHDTNPMLDSLTTLTGKDLVTTLTAVKTSLASAQSSALIIDNALSTLTSIPFLSITPYKPDVSLHTALANVSTSLDSLSPALAIITTSLASGKTNLGTMEDKLNDISATTKGISTALGTAQTVIQQYQVSTTRLKTQVETAQIAAPGWITGSAVMLSLVLVWSLAAQVGLLAQGLEMLQRRRKMRTVVAPLRMTHLTSHPRPHPSSSEK